MSPSQLLSEVATQLSQSAQTSKAFPAQAADSVAGSLLFQLNSCNHVLSMIYSGLL